MQPARRQHRRVLQIALAPAPVAHRDVGEAARRLLVAAGQSGEHVHRPAGAAQQGGFDEIVAQDVAAERAASAQVRQPGGGGESGGADDRIVAPVIAVGAVPPRDPVRDHRPIDAAGELLHPREQGAAVDDHRQRLDQPDIGMPLHRRGELHDRLGGHHAVGVQHQHQRIGAAEAAHPVGDVAGLALGIGGAAAVEDAGFGAGARAQCQERRLLGHPDVGVGGVAEDEEVERIEPAGPRQRVVDRLHAGHHPRRLLVIGRHQQRGAQRQRRQRADVRDAEPPPVARDHARSRRRGAGGRERDPGEQQHEQAEQNHLRAASGRRRRAPGTSRQPAATVIAAAPPITNSRRAAIPRGALGGRGGRGGRSRSDCTGIASGASGGSARNPAVPGRGGQGVHR